MKNILTILFLGFALGATAVVPALAQKGQKKEAAPATQNSIKDILAQYVGKTTNLGTLKKVTGDYFVLEEDGDTVMHPLSTIHTIKLMKDKDSGEIKVEIRLVGRD